jgi:peptidoglycan/xylan/chitin deacetylase (PgdA/CDA1 family)
MQIGCVALVLLIMAACMGNTIAAPASVAAVPPGPGGRTTVVSDDQQLDTLRPIRTFQVSRGDADRKPAPEPKESDGKVIYLTFDDGPTVKYTKQVLDVLDQYDAKATFFEVGENATAHPQLTRAVVERGHALGNHTWNHKDLRKLKPRKLNDQITRTSAALSKISGRPVTCLRPPYGAVNARVRSAVRRKELAMKLWDIDPRDWKRPGAKAIARRVLSHARSGRVSLMHDGGGNRSQSVKALRRILQSLSKEGYSFKTLPGC